jgi:hypothetical protein
MKRIATAATTAASMARMTKTHSSPPDGEVRIAPSRAAAQRPGPDRLRNDQRPATSIDVPMSTSAER